MEHTTDNNILQQLREMLVHKDLFLFSRRILDLIADTNDMQLYGKGIAYIAQYTKLKNQFDEQYALSQALYKEVEHINLPIANQDQSYCLEVDNITKSYGLHKFQLGPISLSIKKGQVYGLVGENGNGKTTLLRLLAMELAPDNGTITYNLNALNRDNYDRRTRLIYIPQRTEKWYGSLLDNLRFTAASYGVEASEIELRVLLMVARLGLWKYKDLQWNELSSGYKMRFELARTLLRQPEVMLLDEPLANLDILSQQIILEDLKHICASPINPIALILSSQQLYEVEKVSDKVIFLKQGQYKDNHTEESGMQASALIVEIDTTASRAEVEVILSTLPIKSIQHNGGIFIIVFESTTTFNMLLQTISTSNINIIYIRNISHSTRRYFIA